MGEAKRRQTKQRALDRVLMLWNLGHIQRSGTQTRGTCWDGDPGKSRNVTSLVNELVHRGEIRW